MVAGLRWMPALFFLFDDGNHVGVATLVGDGPGAGGVAMGMDARSRIGSMLHEKAHHLRPPIHHRKVNGSMLVAVRHGEIGDLRPCSQHCAHSGKIAGVDGVRQAPDGDAIHVRF
jgi:hypothetical protein